MATIGIGQITAAQQAFLDPAQVAQQNLAYLAKGGANDDKGGATVKQSNVPLTNAQISASSPTATLGAPPPTTVAGKSGTSNATATAKSKPGKRLQNPLGNFSSYTYQISLYMITPDAYDAFLASGKKNIGALQTASTNGAAGQGAYLVAQSGGINNTTSKRAPGFDLDFYIDDLKLKQIISGKDTATSTNIQDLSFNVYEPYGFSFLTKLRTAADALAATPSKTKKYEKLENPTRQFFIIGIRFLGYDKDGKLLSAANQPGAVSAGAGLYERYFDIKITDIKFKIDGRMVVYSCKAVSVPVSEVLGTKRGILDNGAEVIGGTVDDAFMGSTDGKIGMFTKLNNDQKKLLDSGAIEIANKWKVTYLGESENTLKTASIVSKADLDKLKWKMTDVKTTKEVNVKSEGTSTVDPNQRKITIPKGTPILQAIQQVITQSSFIERALNKVYTTAEEPDPSASAEGEIKPDGDRTISWYNVSAEIKNLGWDNKQSDFAYEINYIFQPYSTPVVISPYIKNTPKYYGPSKRYEYWFTGKNSEILKYEQSLDNAYFNVAIAPGNADTNSQSHGASQQIPTVANKQQNQPKQGSLNVGREAQNSYLTSLFDPGSYASAKVSILGDPDYLMEISASSVQAVYDQFYGPDGYTISPNGGQVFIEINFKEPVDYKNSTGLLTVNESILFYVYPELVKKDIDSRGGGVSYQLTEVDHSFSKGKFEQELTCIINTFSSVDDKSTAANGREDTSIATAESARLASAGTTSATTPSGTSTTQSTGFVQSPVATAPPPVAAAISAVQTQVGTIPTKTGIVANDDSGSAAAAMLAASKRPKVSWDAGARQASSGGTTRSRADGM